MSLPTTKRIRDAREPDRASLDEAHLASIRRVESEAYDESELAVAETAIQLR